MRAPPSRPNHLPKAPPPSTITLWGLGFQHDFGGRVHKHSVYSTPPQVTGSVRGNIKCHCINLYLKLDSDLDKTDLYEELNLFRNIVLQESSDLDV